MTLKQRIAAEPYLLGTFLKTPAPMLIEVLSTCGLDLVCIDAEHAPFGRETIDLCILAARAAAFPLIVRTPTSAPEHIMNALDCGGDGVLLPHIRSVEEARAAAAACAYGPGGRGYAGSTRVARYGLAAMAEHRAAEAGRTVAIAQIEDVEAIDVIEAIAAVPGLDALFVGRVDLTVAYGAASPDAPEVIAAVDKVIAAGRAAGRPVGMFVPRNEDVAAWRAKGASIFLQSSDHGLMRAGAAALRQTIG